MLTARKHEYEIDIDKGLKRLIIKAPLAVGDAKADVFRLKLLKGGEALDLSGCTITGCFVRPDFRTVREAGMVSGNECEITLDEDCYTYEGGYTFAVNVESPNKSPLFQTVAIFEGLLIATQTEAIIEEDPCYLLDAEGNNIVDANGFYIVVY